jgi:hypothetical protein
MLEATLQMIPHGRFSATDVRALAAVVYSGAFDQYARCLYHSPHTTGGYLSHSLATRLRARGSINQYIDMFRAVFPERAGYQHDDLDKRKDLNPIQRCCEPLNGDSHLAFIGSGLHPCVSCVTAHRGPVYFIDLDGEHAGMPRHRVTTLIGYNREIEVARMNIDVPVSSHPIDAVNLKDDSIGLFEQIAELLDRYEVVKGRIRLALAPAEPFACITINEYETLLIRHDLAEVLANPCRFALEKARRAWEDPRAIADKAIDSVKDDLVHAINQFVETLGLRASHLERIVELAVGAPAWRFLRSKRSVDLLVSDSQSPGHGQVIEGQFQTPIMLQWRCAAQSKRMIQLTLLRFV